MDSVYFIQFVKVKELYTQNVVIQYEDIYTDDNTSYYVSYTGL